MSSMPVWVALIGLASLSDASPLVQPSLTSLNQTCRGRVFAAAPVAQPCFSNVGGIKVPVDQAQCLEISANYMSGSYLTNRYSGFMHDYNQICASSNDPLTAQCLLDPSNPAGTAGLSNLTCGQGSVSPYYIEISGPDDVKAAFNYARRIGQTLSIKNSGHDYASRSSLKGSLALWTRKLQKKQYQASFIPEGCGPSTQPLAAMTIGAGVNYNEAYTFAEQNNATFVGGSSPTVGASGGPAMTGGHGLLSSQFGLGIDRVLQYKLVTPDGVFRTANACQNPDLFWALRGGGGGTFGVVLESTSKVEPRVTLIYAQMQLPSNLTNTTHFTHLLIDHAVRLSREGWGGPSGTNYLAMANPFVTLAEGEASMAPLAAYVRAVGGTVILEQHASFYSVYEQYIQPAANAGVGAAVVATSQMIPTEMMMNAAGKEQLQAYLGRLGAAGFAPTMFQTTPAYQQHQGLYQEGSTSATPAWRKSTWLVVSSAQWEWNSTVAEKKAVVRAVKEVTRAGEELAPGSGSYISEADPWTENWQESWWGEANYAKLLRLKAKYDPYGLLICWRCVGWSESSGQQGQPFACMGGLDD